jgi:hypothetical protein
MARTIAVTKTMIAANAKPTANATRQMRGSFPFATLKGQNANQFVLDDKLKQLQSDGENLFAGCVDTGGFRSFGGFAGAADDDVLLALMVEVDVEDGSAAVVPNGLGDGEVEEDHAFGGLTGIDHGFAEERCGREGFELGEGGEDVGEVALFGGAGGDLLAVAGGECGGEVFKEEGKAEVVFDAEGSEDVEVVLGGVVVDKDGVGFEDRVGRVDGGAGDAEICGLMWGVAEEQGNDDAEYQKRQEDWRQEIATRGLGKGRVGHWHEHSKSEGISGSETEDF